MIVTSAQQAKEYKKFCKGPSMKSDTTREQMFLEMAQAYIGAGKTLAAFADYLQNVVIDEKKRRGEDAKI